MLLTMVLRCCINTMHWLQVFQEQFGGATATIDIELNTQVAQLQASQAAYRNILRLAISMNDHLFGMVQAQKELSACFGELSAHQPELHQEFATNQESQKILYKNGASLLGALNFFTENLGTLVYTTIEDTMASYRDYQMNRLEYDAERLEFDKVRSVPPPTVATPLPVYLLYRSTFWRVAGCFGSPSFQFKCSLGIYCASTRVSCSRFLF